ncbi:MFS transporter [Chania multitudinisentens RB-25]|uniref:MFS transporter n=1 Tax=Chania multitudinisentens RB-25 TaxID=1441930 RepID=W0L8Q8_9GAMM|nr:UTRA domain-containing protein [Chania multitudinisentens]AHG18652.1 MFS transporter [Chania multitudinisentens RB-25]
MSEVEATTTVSAICQALLKQIDDGNFSTTGRLPAERLLCEQFSTTRITLREALSQIEAQGIIYREVRKGWFISPPRIIYNPLQRSHFHQMAREQGRAAQTVVLDACQMEASSAIGEKLLLPAKSQVFRIRRLRYLDGRAVLYVEHYLNPEFFPGILETDLTQSLTDLYADRYGIRYGRVRFDVLPTLLPKRAASALKIADNSPTLFITRINRDRLERVIDCDLEFWRYDALHIDVETG